MNEMKPRRLINDCFLHDKDRLRHDEALAILRERLAPVTDAEAVEIGASAGRFLCSPITSPRPIPGHDNAAVDGYAFRHADFSSTGGRFFIQDRIAAGDQAVSPLAQDQAVRIFTGAAMPEGADTVAMQEDCTLETTDRGQVVNIPEGLKSGANRRLAGEDVGMGEIIAQEGDPATPAVLAQIAACGIAEVPVFKPLRVALISSGNELREPGEPFSHGIVYDSNRPLLSALLSRLPVRVTDLGILKDDANGIRSVLEEAANKHDVVITSGGASLGEEDHLIDALDALGSRHMWQMAIKPGRPMCFGQIGDTAIFGLPGNPVAGFVCFLLYVHPSIRRLCGGAFVEPERYPLPVDFEIASKKTDRREYWRGWTKTNPDGQLVLEKYSRDGSGLISGLRAATGLIEVPEETSSVKTGDVLNFIPLSQFGA